MPNEETAFCETTHLSEARTAGYHNYRIPGLLVTRRGIVLATTEARRGAGGDWDGNDALLPRSLDGGLSWHPPSGPGPLQSVMVGGRTRRRNLTGSWVLRRLRLVADDPPEGPSVLRPRIEATDKTSLQRRER